MGDQLAVLNDFDRGRRHGTWGYLDRDPRIFGKPIWANDSEPAARDDLVEIDKQELQELRADVESFKADYEYYRDIVRERAEGRRLMEHDLGKLRTYLGTKLFDEITTGVVKAPEPPAAPRGFNWSEARLVR